MAEISGAGGKVMKGSVVVASLTQWSISGFVGAVVEVAAFGDTIKTYLSEQLGDPGTISFTGNYDPADNTGKAALETICESGATCTDLYLYANTSTFWRVSSGGAIICTRAKAVTFPRSGLGSVSYEGQVSAAAMEQVGTGS